MKELVERAKNYDEQAFDELILSMEKEMYLIAKSRLRNEEDIADAIQETILSCYKNIHKLKHNELFSAWTIRILINKCNDIYKKRKKQEICLVSFLVVSNNVWLLPELLSIILSYLFVMNRQEIWIQKPVRVL